MQTVRWTGPGSALNRILLDYRRDNGLPSRDEARFELSRDMWDSYRAALVERVGGAAEFRRLRKKRADKGIRYAGYPVVAVDSLPPGTINFVD